MVLGLLGLAAGIPASIGTSAGVSSAVSRGSAGGGGKDSNQKSDQEEEERGQECHLTVYCGSSSRKAVQVHGKSIFLHNDKACSFCSFLLGLLCSPNSR